MPERGSLGDTATIAKRTLGPGESEAVLEASDPKDKRYFDEDRIPNDVWSVLRAASLLSVGEFRVFEIAYEQWYGERGEEKQIERHFISYMFHDIVPVWVRHFCQRVMELDQEDALDPADFGIVCAAATPEQRNRGLEIIMLLVVILIAFFFIGESAARLMDLHCTLPPCY